MQASFVVPVYKEEANIIQFVSMLKRSMEQISDDYELIFALDPSPDKSEELIMAERLKDPRVKLIKFSRRFGQPMATLGGLAYSKGDFVIVMDVDMQDPLELISPMIAKWKNGYDVVIPQRISRVGEPWLKKLIAKVGYGVIAKIGDIKIPPNTGDFRLMSRRVVDYVLELKEGHGFLRGMVALVGFKQCLIPFQRPARLAGETNYNRFLGSLRIGFNGIFGFSSYALTLSTQFGFLVAGCSFVLAITYGIMKLAGANFPLGNPTIVVLLLFLGGVQLISVGILGEYIGRIYDEVRQRPKFIVERLEGL